MFIVPGGETIAQAVVSIDGVVCLVSILPDDVEPDPLRYGPEDLRRHSEGLWRMVGVRVVCEQGDASLWGVEFGSFLTLLGQKWINIGTILTESYAVIGDEEYTMPEALLRDILEDR